MSAAAVGLLGLDTSIMDDVAKLELIEALEAKLTEFDRTKLYRYKPYPKQKKFHDAGRITTISERILIAANQVGKTWSAAAEVAMHLTGQYPDWWEGARWDYAPCGWAGSETAQVTRDTVQRLLMGKPEEWGTGMIPGDLILGIKRAAGSVADCIETVTVRHSSGGISRLTFKNYAQSREAWQGETLDFLWFDEEPPLDIYMEGITRTNATEGIILMTFTPLKGMSAVVKRFLKEKAPGTYVVNMTLEDAGHYTPEQRAAIEAKYPEHERKARAKGIPIMGSGMIYPIAESVITCDAFSIPAHWPRLCSLDFGYDHPTAAIWIAWDRDSDTVYVYDAYRVRQESPVVHAAAINARGKWIPVMWPHDGVAHDKGGGEPLRNQYQKLGCNMHPEKATHPPKEGEEEGTGGYSVEAGLLEILDRMLTGRFKVFSHLADWFEEYRLYHRQDGKIVKEDDDLMDATRGGVMMLRHAKVKPRPKSKTGVGFKPFDPAMNY